MTNYSVSIIEATKELTSKEKIMMKDTADALKLDELTEGGNSVLINPADYVILSVHNEKSDNKDYEQLLILGNDGNKYITGSVSFIDTFKGIFSEMSDCNEEWGVKVFKLPSKNYKGKYFLTCSVF